MRRAREAGEVRGQGIATYHFHFHPLAQQVAANTFLEHVSYSVERLYEAAVINCLYQYQPGRTEGGRGVAYLYVSQLYRTRLDVVLAGHVTLVARIGKRYEF